MTNALPLLFGPEVAPDSPFAWRRGVAMTRNGFLSDVARLADALPDRGHVLNACADRYRFSVGIAAAIVRGQVSLLPPTTTQDTVRHLRERFDGAYCLTDSERNDIDLPQFVHDREDHPSTGSDLAVPAVPIDRTVALVFTSGSTGTPTAHLKRWGSLVENIRSAADRLGLDGRAAPAAIVATVPPQHMYGFESSVLLAFHGGAALVAERPFYAADIAAALERVPAPRLLVTTPFHLRALLDEAIALPEIGAMVCATAPLSHRLAVQAEQRCGAPLIEIYGCTETGQLASRRPTLDPRWRLLGEVTLACVDGRTIASCGHVDRPTLLADVIELAPDFDASRRFALAGRSTDMVNIAGKRSSLGYLDAQLNAIPGVVDGAFFMPADDRAEADGVTRLAAVVVAPTLDARRLGEALRARIDPAFLPRPIHFVVSLPRNATGKLTQAALRDLVARPASEVAPAVSRGARP